MPRMYWMNSMPSSRKINVGTDGRTVCRPFNHITFHYGKKCIFEDLSLTVEESQIMCLVGPSGCGKTTLVRCLLGFIKPETGSIYVGDRCLFDAEKGIDVSPEHRHIGVVFQDYAVWPHMTVLENVLYPMKKMRLPKEEMKERAHHALEQVRMLGYEEHLPSQLSGGQQQRVAIARALVSSDEVIVMDEPITNLDAKLREEMLTEIRLIQHDIGTTILYITHDQEAALQLCDRMAIMDREGKLCQIGEDEDIILRPANRFVFEFIGVSNFFPLVRENGHTYLVAGEKFLYDECPPEIFASGKPMEMGSRLNDMVFDDQSPIRGKITRSVFLGSEYVYFIQLGNREIRMQVNALDVMQNNKVEEGQEVGLRFLQPRYYEARKEDHDESA